MGGCTTPLPSNWCGPDCTAIVCSPVMLMRLLNLPCPVAVTWAAHQLGAPSKLTAAYQSPGVLTSSSLVLALKVGMAGVGRCP